MAPTAFVMLPGRAVVVNCGASNVAVSQRCSSATAKPCLSAQTVTFRSAGGLGVALGAAGALMVGRQRRQRRGVARLASGKRPVNFMKIEGSRTTFASDEGEEFEMDTSKVLGVGAQGKVHPGKNTKTGQEVAVKSMPVKHLILDEAGAAKIKLIDDEIEIGKAIGTHPNIAGLIAGCDLYREGTSDHPHFKNIVMELVQ
ncbi:unnamed protein product, partial [Polarella glacialis]